MARAIQREAADALLDAGVSVPLKELKVPLLKRPVKLRVTLRRPRLAGQIRLARTYLSMGVTAEKMARFTKEEEMSFVAAHGHKVAMMLAEAVCAGAVRRRFARPVAWLIRECVEPRVLVAAMRRLVSLMGTDPFLPIIRSAEGANPMKPRLSRDAEGS